MLLSELSALLKFILFEHEKYINKVHITKSNENTSRGRIELRGWFLVEHRYYLLYSYIP